MHPLLTRFHPSLLVFGLAILTAALVATFADSPATSSGSSGSSKIGRTSIGSQARPASEPKQRAELFRSYARTGDVPSNIYFGPVPLTKGQYQVWANLLYAKHTMATFEALESGEISESNLDEVVRRSNAFADQLDSFTPPREVAEAHATFVEVYRSFPQLIKAYQMMQEFENGNLPSLGEGIETVAYMRGFAKRVEAAQDQYEDAGYILVPFTMGSVSDDLQDKLLTEALELL